MAIFSEAQMSFIPSEFPTENSVKYANGTPYCSGSVCAALYSLSFSSVNCRLITSFYLQQRFILLIKGRFVFHNNT